MVHVEAAGHWGIALDMNMTTVQRLRDDDGAICDVPVMAISAGHD